MGQTKPKIKRGKTGKAVRNGMKTKRHLKLSELLAQCKGKNPYGELITGRVGKELF